MTIGALVAPAAFSTLESRELAGRLVGETLRRFNYLSLASCAILWLAFVLRPRAEDAILAGKASTASLNECIWLARPEIALLAGLSIVSLLLAVLMREMTALQPLIASQPLAATRFRTLHSIYGSLTLVSILCGVALFLIYALRAQRRGEPHSFR